MSKLILIRHANSAPSADVPSELWPLTPEGEARCKQLAMILRPLNIVAIHTSALPRAVRTGELLSAEIDIPLIAPNQLLNEHDRRTNAPFFEDKADFIAAVEQFFEHPDEYVYGAETANEVVARFRRGVDAVRASAAGKPVALVSHGTVMATFVAKLQGIEPFGVWRQFQQLGMPMYVVLDATKALKVEQAAGLD